MLPHSLYYLSDQAGGSFQIWQLSADGSDAKQVTNEARDISDFDVSPSNGQVAYITNNQLYLINSNGSGRTLLINGDSVGEQDSSYYFSQNLTGISWSPDGERLSYGLNGIHIYFSSANSAINF